MGRDSVPVSIDELREIVVPIAETHGILSVYLFGSRARGESGDGSDFDLCFTAPDEYDLIDIGSFLYDLEEALGTKVDLVREKDLIKRPHLMDAVFRDRRVLFEA